MMETEVKIKFTADDEFEYNLFTKRYDLWKALYEIRNHVRQVNKYNTCSMGEEAESEVKKLCSTIFNIIGNNDLEL